MRSHFEAACSTHVSVMQTIYHGTSAICRCSFVSYDLILSIKPGFFTT